MAKKAKIPGTAEAWESGALGEDSAHAKPVSDDRKKEIDDALGLQMISIRLPKGVIETYKLLASLHGVGYQPLMRDAICRFAESETKQVLIAAAEAKRQEKEGGTEPSVEPLDLPKAA